MSLGLALGLILAISAQEAPYDADPHHPWNDLHRSLFTWCPTKADLHEEYEGDPRFWPLAGEFSTSWTTPKDLLEQIGRFKESLFKDPLKRAILQHDVWMFLDGLEGLPMSNTRTYPLANEDLRNELRRRLVPLLRQLALSPEEIRTLPDNYAQAVKSKTYRASFDLDDSERPFLPADLWESEGPWVLVGREDDAVLAEQHVKLLRGAPRSSYSWPCLGAARRPSNMSTG